MARTKWLLFLGLVLLGLACGKLGGARGGAPERSAGKVEPSPTVSKAGEKGKVQAMKTIPSHAQVAVLAGGCFWGMEEILRGIDGVLDTEVGYAGGQTESPTYEMVRTGRTGHAESVQIVFDPARLSYADLLEKWFFRMHDPTTENRQGNDRGTQYRSAIFTMNEEQAKTAREVIARVDASGVWRAPIVTEVVPAGPFTPAEDYHQDYLQEHPNGYTCHWLRDF